MNQYDIRWVKELAQQALQVHQEISCCEKSIEAALAKDEFWSQYMYPVGLELWPCFLLPLGFAQVSQLWSAVKGAGFESQRAQQRPTPRTACHYQTRFSSGAALVVLLGNASSAAAIAPALVRTLSKQPPQTRLNDWPGVHDAQASSFPKAMRA